MPQSPHPGLVHVEAPAQQRRRKTDARAPIGLRPIRDVDAATQVKPGAAALVTDGKQVGLGAERRLDPR